MTAVLTGLGAWLPSRVVTNEDVSENLDTSPEWIETRTGIRCRRQVQPGETMCDLAVQAGRRALASAGSDRVGAIVVATTSPDRLCPATGPEVATRLNQGTIPAYDVASACSGFLYGLATAIGLIEAHVADDVLMIGAEAFTTLVDPNDRVTRPIFGDGAGAVVLTRGDPEEHGAINRIVLGSDGSQADLLAINAGGSRQRSSCGGLGFDQLATSEWYLHMEGRAIFTQAVMRMTECASSVLARHQWSCADVDWFVGHQANARILYQVAEDLGIAPEKVAINIDRVGNTLAASVPLLLADMAFDGRLRPGQRILIGAFGAGLSWGATVLLWPDIAVEAVA